VFAVNIADGLTAVVFTVATVAESFGRNPPAVYFKFTMDLIEAGFESFQIVAQLFVAMQFAETALAPLISHFCAYTASDGNVGNLAVDRNAQINRGFAIFEEPMLSDYKKQTEGRLNSIHGLKIFFTKLLQAARLTTIQYVVYQRIKT
jgi:hypothetical protein